MGAAVATAILGASLFGPGVAWGGVVNRVSVASDGTQANGASFGAVLSADGRFVAFSSEASNLVSGDTNGVCDIVLHDRVTGATTRVSVGTDGSQGNAASECGSNRPALSSDGRFIAFGSAATNLVTGDTNGFLDVFVHDRVSGVTTRVSVAGDGAQANKNSYVGGISADGRFVTFSSAASNLVPGDTNEQADVFVHDRLNATTTRVSVLSDGTQANGSSRGGALSANGRFVAFTSDAPNLVSTCSPNAGGPAFIHDRLTGVTTCERLPGLILCCQNPALSADGRVVALNQAAATTNQIFLRERDTGATSAIFDHLGALRPALNADGRVVAYWGEGASTQCRGTGSGNNIIVVDRATPEIRTCVSVAVDGALPNGGSVDPAVSADGRVFAFESDASNLVPGDSNGVRDIFVAIGPPLRFFLGGVFVAAGDLDGTGAAELVTGAGPGGGPHVRAFGADGFRRGTNFFAYDPAFAGGVRLAACDFDADGRVEIVTGAGPGGGPHVRVVKLDGTGQPLGDLASFFAYDPAFAGGVYVACGHIDGTGVPLLVTGADAGGGPHVRLLRLQSGAPGGVVPVLDFFAFDPGFLGGVRVAAGNVDGSDRSSIVVGAGPGGGPHVRVLKFVGGALVELASFFAYTPAFAGGVFVAAGDVTGAGVAEIVTGADAGGSPHVRAFTGPGGDAGISFFAYDQAFAGGVRVAVGDLDGDGVGEILTGPGAGGAPHVRGFTGTGVATATSFFAY